MVMIDVSVNVLMISSDLYFPLFSTFVSWMKLLTGGQYVICC